MTVYREWENEADSALWDDANTGLPCAIIRHSEIGHLCGYVGVPAGHLWFGKDYDQCEPSEVHGGLTFARNFVPTQEPDGNWWVGFDCAHAGDLCPSMKHHDGDVYRSMAYVRRECERLAAQAIEAGTGETERLDAQHESAVGTADVPESHTDA